MTRKSKKAIRVATHAVKAFWQENYGEQFEYVATICKEVKSVTKRKLPVILLWLVLNAYAVAMDILSWTPFNIPVLSDVSSCLNFVLRLVKDWAEEQRMAELKKRRRNKRRRKDRRRPLR